MENPTKSKRLTVKATVLFIWAACFSFLSLANAGAPPSAKNEAAAVSPTPPPGENDETLRIETTLVSLPVSVLDRNGKFIPNLRRENFRVYENDIEQQIEYFAPVEQPFTVVLLIDRSDSVAPIINNVKKAARAFIDQMRPNDRVIGIAFDRDAYVLNKKVRDRDELRTAITGMTTGAGTLLYDVVEKVLWRFLGGLPGRKALVLLTDGADAWSWEHPKNAAPRNTAATNVRAAEEFGTFVYSIQFDSRWRTKEGDQFMRDIAARSGGRFYRADKLKDFNSVFSLIADELRFQYSIGYYPKIAAEKGERRRIKVQTDQPQTAVRTRASYVFK